MALCGEWFDSKAFQRYFLGKDGGHLRSQQSFKIAFFISVFLHGFLFWALRWMPDDKQTPPTSVEVALLESKSLMANERPVPRAIRHSQKENSDEALRDVLFKNDYSGSQLLKAKRAAPADDSEIGRALNPYGNQGVHEIRQNKTIWNDIFISIERPQFLEEYNHEGKVIVKFEVDGQGQLIEESLRACAEDNVLKVLSVQSIRKALRRENSQKKISKHYTASFHWSESCNSERATGIQDLHFCIKTRAKQRTFSKSEKAATYLKALSYGFGAIEEIKKYNQEETRRENGFSPFEKLKNSPDWHLSC